MGNSSSNILLEFPTQTQRQPQLSLSAAGCGEFSGDVLERAKISRSVLPQMDSRVSLSPLASETGLKINGRKGSALSRQSYLCTLVSCAVSVEDPT